MPWVGSSPERGIKIVLDYKKLKHNYRIKPFCIYGYYEVNKYVFKTTKKMNLKNDVIVILI